MSEAWEALAQSISGVRERIAALAPDAETATEGEAYVARVLTGQLSNAMLGHLLVENGFARALPTHGCPNPDYLMRHAGIDTSAHYRVSGKLNASERIGIGLYRFDATGTAFEVGYAAFDRSNTAPDGTFALELAPGASGPGSLAIPPEARVILVRVLHLAKDEPAAELRLEGPTTPPGLALATGSVEGALGMTANGLAKTIEQFLEWTRVTSAKPNRIESAPPHLAEAVQGDPDTAYYLGYFDLEENETLEVTMPRSLPGYWSLHAYNHWTESLQTQGMHNRNARTDDDGRIRIAVGHRPSSRYRNRIDTLGRKRGILICRIIGAAGSDAPAARLVQLEEET